MKLEVVNLRGDGRPQYRLGDAVLRRDQAYGRAALDMVARAGRFFEGTLLHGYAHRIDRDSPAPQWPVLRGLVRHTSQRLGFDLPGNDELIVHLRLGNAKGYAGAATTFVDSIVAILDDLGPAVSSVSVVTAVHFGATFLDRHRDGDRPARAAAEHRRTVAEIMQLLSVRNLAARLISRADVDLDFCTLANARYLVLGNGHFSLCAAMVSDAVTFVPSWARSGTDLNVDELLHSRGLSASLTIGRAQRSVSC